MILLVGASASGKTEIAKCLREEFHIVKAITHTTRAMRVGEKNGVDYHFVSQEEFASLEKEGAFVETASYNGNHYGSSKAEVADDKVLIVEPKGLKAYLALGDPRIVSFYLQASRATRENRMKSRGDKPEAILSRLANDDIDFSEENLAKTDYVIATDTESVLDLSQKVYSLYLAKINSL
ncbi:MAG: guanylate kinase [Bacilli bacterium]|nr:guanylate kinase [Bacilli bacterium]